MSRRTAFLAAAAVAVLTVSALPANAAMPVADAAQIESGSGVLLAQAPAASGEQTTAPKAKKKSKRQKEIDSSVESGTVPKRYRSSVPKEYHHLIPFSK